MRQRGEKRMVEEERMKIEKAEEEKEEMVKQKQMAESIGASLLG
jgi:hypothetical protein